jgi:uncharacterized membrane protein
MRRHNERTQVIREFIEAQHPNPIDWLFPLMVLVFLAAIVYLLFRSLQNQPVATGTDPLQRAASRYAAGEIERVEFERIQQDLTSQATATTQLEDAALRLARGEITTAEFEEIRKRLEDR